MDARTDLGTGPDQDVRVDHRALSYPSPDVDVGRRHDRDARGQVDAASHRRAARDDSPGPSRRQCGESFRRIHEALERQADTVAELERALDIPRFGGAVGEEQEDRLLYCRVHAPAVGSFGVGFGRPDSSFVQGGQDSAFDCPEVCCFDVHAGSHARATSARKPVARPEQASSLALRWSAGSSRAGRGGARPVGARVPAERR